ncbi:MAG: DEAD/DEAH box helicase [Sulfurospirillum sp.]|nr:DEAD/DEAH box helicase [Sulfurospirillum sp.]
MAKMRFGMSPWGAAFLRSIEQRCDDGRLARGKSYASSGKVYDISLASSSIGAKVRGNYKPYYKTKLRFHEFARGDKKFIISYIEKNPLVLAQIIHAKLSPQILKYLQKNEIDLFQSFEMDCTCPDFYGTYPCKHIAGLYFVLVSEIDKNPFILFSLRGLDLVEHFGIKKDLQISYPLVLDFLAEDGQEKKSEENCEILQIRSQKEFILSMLESNPPFAPFDYKLVLDEFYDAIAKKLPLIIWASHSENMQKCEKILQSATISFVGSRTLNDAKFKISSPLFAQEQNRAFFGTTAQFDAQYSLLLSPMELMNYCICFEQEEGSSAYRYFFYLARIVYILLQKSAFLPCVFLQEEQLRIFYKPFCSSEVVRKQFENLAEIAPHIVRIDGKKLDGFSESEFLAMVMLSDVMPYFAFMHKAQKNNPPQISHTFFAGTKQYLSGFEEQNIARSIRNYFAIFDLIKSDFIYKIAISKTQEDYKLALLLEDKKTKNICNLHEKIATCKDMQIVSFVSHVATFLPQIEQLIEVEEITLSKELLEDFILHSSQILSNLGVQIILPKELQNILKPKLILKVKTTNKNMKSFFSLDDMLEYDWQIALGDLHVSLSEFEKMVAGGKELIAFAEHFVLLDPKELQAIFAQINRKTKLNKFEILQAKLNDEAVFDTNLEMLFTQIFTHKDEALPTNLRANLRAYQKRGIAWSIQNLLNGFGIILADDMGLGKTLQAIAVVLYLKEQKLCKQSLVIVPTSLLSNWEAEIQKFAPTLSFSCFYGANRSWQKADIILSTYDVVRRDMTFVKKQKIDTLIIDEAQKIKNPDTNIAKAVKSLRATYKIALSGTPIENNLSELWSIFDFAIPKYLKSLSDFSKEYAKDIEIHKDASKIKKLKKITSAFMLRRLKTDRTIIKDLPQKIIIDEYATMSTQQASLYQAALEEMLDKLQTQEKKGAIFKLLVSLKQICNHPRNFDKTSPSQSELSGKTELLLTLLEAILQKNEKVLIFTQYTQMAQILSDIIQKELLMSPLYLSGEMSKQKRDEAVQDFQTKSEHKIFILSLKAGGVGLNLTQANHVIHYDLWFNPAVENQATDRAFRIGQKKNVFVYRFITKNSFEEKIDKMIKAKKELSDLSVHVGESWLKDMNAQELQELFSLSV